MNTLKARVNKNLVQFVSDTGKNFTQPPSFQLQPQPIKTFKSRHNTELTVSNDDEQEQTITQELFRHQVSKEPILSKIACQYYKENFIQNHC